MAGQLGLGTQNPRLASSAHLCMYAPFVTAQMPWQV